MARERLQKLIAAAGISSRRKAEQLILDGLVTVNGKVVRELGSRADPQKDHIRVRGKLIRAEPLEYYAVHKPQGIVSSTADPHHRDLVTRLVPSSRRLYPAGRLDAASEGLVILTNDGLLTRRLTRAGGVEKVYRVKVRGAPGAEKIGRLRRGIRIGSETLRAARVRQLKKGANSWYQVTLLEGRNRQIRRMFEKLGHPVMRLRRVEIGPVSLGSLPPGGFRKLTASEVELLKENVKGPPSARGRK